MVEPPTATAIHRRQRIAWAHWGRDMAYGYDDPRYDHRENLEAWHQAAPGGLTVVQYYSDNFAEPWILPPFALAIAVKDTRVNEAELLKDLNGDESSPK